MTSYEFTLVLNRDVTDAEVEALYEAGCADGGVEAGPRGTRIDFDREAPSLAEAITSAARDIEKVPGLRAAGVACDTMVSMLDIATRAGVTREAVRLWSTGRRGPGGFPKPVLVTTGGEKLWDWEQAARWLAGRGIYEWGRAEVTIRILGTANRVLAARDALLSEPDHAVREEFERLLEGA